MEQRRNASTNAVKKIEEMEALCAKSFEQVSQTWESLIDDEDLEKFVKQLCTSKIEVNQLKNEMKKLPLVEKMDKVVDMKKLQHQVAMLRTQQQQATDRVT